MFSINQEFCLDPDSELQNTLRNYPSLAVKQAREHCSSMITLHDAVVGTANRAYPTKTFHASDRSDRICGFVTGSSLALLALHYASPNFIKVRGDEITHMLPLALQQLNPDGTSNDNTDTFMNSAVVLDHVLPSAMMLRRTIRETIQPPDLNPAIHTLYTTATMNGFSFTAAQMYAVHQSLTQRQS